MDTEPKHQSTASADADYAELYTIGAVAAVLLVAIIAVSVVAFLNWPFAPGTNTTEEIFDLVQRSFPGGLTALDIGVSLGNLLAILLYLALYQALKQTNPSLAFIALAFGLVAAAALIAARPVVEIFVMAESYADATTAAERNRLLAAGDTLLVQFHGMAFKNYLLLGNVSIVISSFLMRRSVDFGRVTAYIGIISYAIGLGFLLPVVGPVLAFLAMPGQALWMILVARVLFGLGRNYR